MAHPDANTDRISKKNDYTLASFKYRNNINGFGFYSLHFQYYVSFLNSSLSAIKIKSPLPIASHYATFTPVMTVTPSTIAVCKSISNVSLNKDFCVLLKTPAQMQMGHTRD